MLCSSALVLSSLRLVCERHRAGARHMRACVLCGLVLQLARRIPRRWQPSLSLCREKSVTRAWMRCQAMYSGA